MVDRVGEEVVATVEVLGLYVAQDTALAVQVPMLIVPLRPQCVLSMDTASVLLTSQAVQSVVLALVEVEHQIPGQVMVEEEVQLGTVEAEVQLAMVDVEVVGVGVEIMEEVDQIHTLVMVVVEGVVVVEVDVVEEIVVEMEEALAVQHL